MAEKVNRDQPSPKRSEWLWPAVLVAIGVILLFLNLTESAVLGILVLPLLGLVFLGWGIYTHEFGFMVPGSVLTGLGIALLLGISILNLEGDRMGGVMLLALSLSFVAMTIFSAFMKKPGQGVQYWPLVPALILGIIAIGLLIGGQVLDVVLSLTKAWPILLVLGGLYLLYKNRRAA